MIVLWVLTGLALLWYLQNFMDKLLCSLLCNDVFLLLNVIIEINVDVNIFYTITIFLIGNFLSMLEAVIALLGEDVINLLLKFAK